MNSFSLLHTNVGLTTNIKIVVGSSYSLYLESINSTDGLEDTKYKKVTFSKDNYYDDLIPYFYDGLASETAYSIKENPYKYQQSDKYSNQYDEIYQCGAKNIENNKDYVEDYEYFAPLYVEPNHLPKHFIIFRVDGAGIDTINKNNFKSNILNNFKVVKIYDFDISNNIGYWLDLNYNNNTFLPIAPFEMSFNNTDFSKWNGIDYESGGYASKSMFLEDYYTAEKDIFGFERYIFDGYKNNKVVFPFILNLSFLFNDEPMNNSGVRYYTLNRYYGFYIDEMTEYKKASPFVPRFLKDNTVLKSGNILYNPDGDVFNLGFIEGNVIEYNGLYYEVIKDVQEGTTPVLQNVMKDGVITQEYMTTTTTTYRINTDIDFYSDGVKVTDFNKNMIYIGVHNNLLNYDNDNYVLDEWDTADVWLMKIDDTYHNVIKNKEGELIINSDYTFTIDDNENYLYYYRDVNNKTKIDLKSHNERNVFTFYKLNFTDIKDFDTRIINTDYSRYEYEYDNQLTNTEETKMYVKNLSAKSIPVPHESYTFNNEKVYIPVSSEYTANGELFNINDNMLTDLWNLNPVYCRWGFQKSLSAEDRPYLLNNSLIFEDFNRTTNIYNANTDRVDRTLDYFYTINSSTSSYVYHSLHVENTTSDGGINTTYKFDFDAYTQSTTDYFTHFFEYPAKFNNNTIKTNVQKYATFNKGTTDIPNTALFRGIKFVAYDIQNGLMKMTDNTLNHFNLTCNNTFDDYKLSILLTSTNDDKLWTKIKKWISGKTYSSNDIVEFNDVLYRATEKTRGLTASKRPMEDGEWSYYTTSTSGSLWNPSIKYSVGDVVFHDNDWFYCTKTMDADCITRHNTISSTIADFYTSDIKYRKDDIVYYKNVIYASNMKDDKDGKGQNDKSPIYKSPYEKTLVNGDMLGLTLSTKLNINTNNYKYTYYWGMSSSATQSYWKAIELYNKNTLYSKDDYCITDDVVYRAATTSVSRDIGDSIYWTKICSIKPQADLTYSKTSNSLVYMNDCYYQYTGASSHKLDNGIDIYINKKWKNILININYNDATLDNLSNADRDSLYDSLYKQLTAFKFIQAINDITNKNGYINYLTYHIIGDDGTCKSYNYDNLSTDALPYYIECIEPDTINMNRYCIDMTPIEKPIDIKINKKLNNNQIYNDLSNLNYYNNANIADTLTIKKNRETQLKDVIYRYSGFYSPIFYTIELFDKSIDGNYVFDTDLTSFGLLPERKIVRVNHKIVQNSKTKSLYPMVGNFGYTTVDSFIFKSIWDNEYNYMTTKADAIIGKIDKNNTVVKTSNLITDNKLADLDIGIKNSILK